MGLVYRAHDTRLQRDVALKILHPGLVAGDELRSRFRREALTLSRLNHPAIATALDFDSDQGVDFLVMELVGGETLKQRLAEGPLEEKEIVRLGIQLADGLSAAHELNVLHRDLKPGNLRITADGRLKILDFGLSKLVRPVADLTATETLTQTLSQGIVGTPPYMSPEQLRGEPLDARSDIHAAGAVLYEFAVGRRPFRETLGPRLIDEILHRKPDAPRDTNPKLSQELQDVILKSLEKDPDDRYQSAADLGADLRSLREAGVVSASLPPRRPRPWRLSLVTVVMVVLAVMIARFVFFPARAEVFDTLAVLPFANVSQDADAEYLCDGITESLINSLAELPSVSKVIARGSVFEYKGLEVDPRDVGRELGVKALVTGRILQRGEELTISVDLVQSNDGRHIWGTQFQRQLTEVFAVQEEITSLILDNLSLELTGEQQARLAKRHTENSEAYRLYLKGRHFMNRWTRVGLDTAIQRFREALELDPGYALAYSGLADAHYAKATIFEPPNVAFPKVKAAATTALKLDESLGTAHASLGLALALFDRDWDAAESEFRRALELSPGQAVTHLWYGYGLLTRERFDEAITEFERAQELDPLTLFVRTYPALAFYFARKYDVALETLGDVIEIDPDYYLAHAFAGLIHEQLGEPDAAVAALEKANREEEAPLEALAQLGRAYAIAGRIEEAEAVLASLETLSKDRFVSAYNIALIHEGLGNRDLAFEFLEQANQERSEWFVMLRVDPRVDDLRNDPRFKKLLQELKQPAQGAGSSAPRFALSTVRKPSSSVSVVVGIP
jgi:serine/threonine-protein kinase